MIEHTSGDIGLDALVGFRVVAGDLDRGYKVDLFELEQCAVECARLVDRSGWTVIKCERVITVDSGTRFEQERCEAIEWRETDPA